MTSVTRGFYDLKKKKTSPIIRRRVVSWDFILAGKREKKTISLMLYFFLDGGNFNPKRTLFSGAAFFNFPSSQSVWRGAMF